ncbi:DMT family transporter [Thauera sp. UPWRP]|nr:DMT family transporter [Thauera sp. UPWRP]
MTAALQRSGLIFAVLGATGFSFKAILVKLAYRHGVDAETLLALRMGFSLPFFLAMGVVASRRAAMTLPARDWGWMLGLGLIGYYLASYFDFLGLKYISAALERLILYLYPTLVIVLSALFLGKPVTRRMMAALGLCYLGIGIAVGHDLTIAGDAGDVVLGSLLVFASAVTFALYLMGNGEVVGRTGSARFTAYATSFACLGCLAQFFVLRPVSALVQPWEVYALALTMAIVSTVAPVWLTSEAIRRLAAGPVSLTSSLGPAITILLGWLLLDEAVGVAQFVGTVMVIGGVAVMARKRN